MNWITKFIKPKIKSLFQKKSSNIEENLWTTCGCKNLIYKEELETNQKVCPKCGAHHKLTCRERFKTFFDQKEFEVIETPLPKDDPLNFEDKKKYTDRLKTATKGGDHKEAMLVVEGEISRTPVVAACQDFSFMGGSMGMYVGNAIIAAAKSAIKLKRPLILFSAAGGARMQEGILSLMQMPRTTVAVAMLKEAKLPYIVVLTHPTTGGVTASYAMLGDIHIAEPNALICFAGPRVIEQTIREKLPEGFQRAEYLLDHGMLDRVIHRKNMKEELVNIIRILTKQPRAIKAKLAPPSTTVFEDKTLND